MNALLACWFLSNVLLSESNGKFGLFRSCESECLFKPKKIPWQSLQQLYVYQVPFRCLIMSGFPIMFCYKLLQLNLIFWAAFNRTLSFMQESFFFPSCWYVFKNSTWIPKTVILPNKYWFKHCEVAI